MDQTHGNHFAHRGNFRAAHQHGHQLPRRRSWWQLLRSFLEFKNELCTTHQPDKTLDTLRVFARARSDWQRFRSLVCIFSESWNFTHHDRTGTRFGNRRLAVLRLEIPQRVATPPDARISRAIQFLTQSPRIEKLVFRAGASRIYIIARVLASSCSAAIT